ncbi:autoinducer 2 sensor kinase/phosphatase LuxQ [Clostridium homopropionicum DSM 5847]|uniref:Circadian input-output histidine kinase CikA n=1 Tax=Clostridium homopropionicum DSM 5847 TaxID=1121318 RepID=A0A0L6ZAS0_9CLOT|nr:AAA family ATPase [Clostridium homopropionicum]KOA20074.1 autoinducer 2 sensor kinase/phosphatase LuxQ [Clostridium homopropionicum DSM 5847]SFG85944.1 Predicted ATPase [Clostridium homopropionicum]
MESFTGFKAPTKIFENQDFIFYKSFSEEDQIPVILKQFTNKNTKEDKFSFFMNELDASKKLNHDGIVKLLNIISYKVDPILILEDFGSDILYNILKNKSFSVKKFLKLAIKLAESVEYLHNANILHLHIKPDNIFVNWDAEIIKLTGFKGNLATSMTTFDNKKSLGEMQSSYEVAYISPEQTGRINCKIDCRSDLYSLGIILYEMLTGKRPFESEDPIEIIHFHIAKEPVPVCLLNPEIPKILSDIIGILLEKKLEKRYETSHELKCDLKECLNRLEFKDEKYKIKEFIPCKRNVCGELFPDEKIFGRETQIKILMDTFESVKMDNTSKIIMVSGYSGVGKTTLVNTIGTLIKSSGYIFIHGKYDQYNNNTPYSSFVQAFDNYFNEILVQGKEQVALWKDKFIQALDSNASMITKIFPKLELIIGPQKHSELFMFNEAQSILHSAFIRFFHAVSKDRPILLFLDDLQWADINSIKLLQYLLNNKENFPILFVGTYRNNEVDSNHPLWSILTQLSKSMTSEQIITLKPLTLQEVSQLVGSLFQHWNQDIESFSSLCFEKSGGNPFFLQQLIKSYKDEGILIYAGKEKKWTINLDQLGITSFGNALSDILIRKLKKLNIEAIEALKVAACMHNNFEAVTISNILDLPYEEVSNALQNSSYEGFIRLSQSDIYSKDIGNTTDTFCFSHDRVKQAVYSLINIIQRSEIHYGIGMYLLEKSGNNIDENENLFEITEHLNQAEDIFKEKMEILFLTKLNLASGKRAASFYAYDRALEYFKRGIETLGSEGWLKHYELTLSLLTEATTAAYASGQVELMKKYGNEVLENGRTLLDKCKIYEIRIEHLTVENKLKEAVDEARYVLSLFNVNLPVNPTTLDISIRYFKIKFALIGRTFEDLKSMPPMRDGTMLAIMRILASAGLAAYTDSEMVFLIITLNIVEISIKYGNSPLSPASYTAYGHFLCSYLNKRETGYQFGRLAIDLQNTMKSKAYECKVNLIFEILLRHNKEPLRNTLNSFPENHQKGLHTGDLNSAGYVIMQHLVYMYLAGLELSTIYKVTLEYKEDLLITGNRIPISICFMYLQGIENLMEGSKVPWEIQGHYYDEKAELLAYEEVNDKAVTFNIYFNKMVIAYLFGQYEEAINNLKNAEVNLKGAIGTFCIPVLNFYSALINLKFMSISSEKTKKRLYSGKAKYFLKKVKSFYKDAPENNENKYYLIKAEEARIYGNYELAIQYFNMSIKSAGKNGFLQEEALGNELAAKMLYSLGRSHDASKYAQAGIACYTKWGCPSKAKQLQYTLKRSFMGMEQHTNVDKFKATENFDSHQFLDLETIIRGSQAISEEIVLSELLKKMLSIVLQNSGARKAFFIMETNGELFVEAQGTVMDSSIELKKAVPLKENSEILEKLINYVVNTRETIILNNTEEIRHFTDDNLSNEKESLSLLCMPIESKRNLVGILYLENDLINGVFTRQHMKILKIFASQLAISIENAKLYQNLEKMVDERTLELKLKNNELENANKKLENADRAKNSFLANMSHEMRTPLNGVIGMASMLQKSRLDGEQKESVDAIIHSAQSLLAIINDILDFSKIQANKIDLEEQNFNLVHMIQELLPAFALKAKEKRINLSCSVKEGSLEFLKGDPLRIKEIIINLLSNAIKFTEKGKVEMEVSSEKIEDTTGVLEITVRDTGIGISEEKLDYIFQDFTQADSSTARRFGGTGLGLSITKKLVEMMNGTIKVKSKLDIGSTFTCKVYLKLPEAIVVHDTSSGEEEYQSIEKLTGYRILVAEDDEISRKYINSILKYLSCEVTIVSDGIGVLEELKLHKFDCILMDKNMPNLDGIETTRIIRRDEYITGAHIPIIALTASAIVGEREKLLSSGMDYYLSKPVNEKELIYTLKSAKKSFVLKKTKKAIKNPSTSQWIEKDIFLEEASLYGEDIMSEILDEFLQGYALTLQRIKNHIENSNFSDAEKEIHRFASTVSIFQCKSFVDTLRQMETYARNQNLENLISSYALVVENIVPLSHELENIKNQLSKKLY